MTWPKAFYWSVLIVCLTYACTSGGMKIDCHDWTADECIAFVESVKQLREAAE